jgi:transposase InsO family protein
VSAEVKELVLKTVDDAVAAGFTHRWACGLWQVSDDRVHRWRARQRDIGTLEDQAPGGTALHRLLPWEVDEILAVCEEWGEVDRSHRKLAHRGSYEGRVWASPATFRRVLAAHGLILPKPPPPSRTKKRPWPDWLVWEPNRIWIYDATHFGRCHRVVFAIVDMVSRYWITTLVSIEESSTQVQVLFDHAIVDQGLDELLTDTRLDLPVTDPRRPILLAVSDNGPPMASADTRAYMAMMAIAQHRGRPHTPTDQAWIESFFGHLKGEWPHLVDIDDPVVLESELERIRTIYNGTRLHEAIGYVTPDDEHYGRGDTIRQARIDGLRAARHNRIQHNQQHPSPRPPDLG